MVVRADDEVQRPVVVQIHQFHVVAKADAGIDAVLLPDTGVVIVGVRRFDLLQPQHGRHCRWSEELGEQNVGIPIRVDVMGLDEHATNTLGEQVVGKHTVAEIAVPFDL